MTITALLMAGLLAFVLLVPTLMVAVLVSGLARRPQVAAEPVTLRGTEPPAAELPAAELRAS